MAAGSTVVFLWRSTAMEAVFEMTGWARQYGPVRGMRWYRKGVGGRYLLYGIARYHRNTYCPSMYQPSVCLFKSNIHFDHCRKSTVYVQSINLYTNQQNHFITTFHFGHPLLSSLSSSSAACTSISLLPVRKSISRARITGVRYHHLNPT